MAKRIHILWIGALLMFANLSYGQVGNYMRLSEKAFELPSLYTNLSIVDGKLYSECEGIMLSGIERNGFLASMEVDLKVMNIDKNVTYIVRHPSSKHLYYTRRGRNGSSDLYEYNTEGKRPTSKMIVVGDSKTSVEHPVFSKDGKIMIFASNRSEGSHGGYDLWYSRYVNGKWQKPHNLGKNINSAGDEINPSIYGEFLIFSSKGRLNSSGGFNLYATRLLSLNQGAVVKMLPIGESVVQSLPSPINTPYDDLELVADEMSDRGYWITSKDSIGYMREFFGSLIGTKLCGRVVDKEDNPVVNAQVIVHQRDYKCGEITTDDHGYYEMYLKSNSQYTLTVKKAGNFTHQEFLNTYRMDDNILINSMRRDVKLDCLEIDKEYNLGNIYGPNADLELSTKGADSIRKVITFLKDNPNLKVEWHVWSDAVEDEKFNQMVTDNRLKTIEQFLTDNEINENRFHLVNMNKDIPMPGDASGESQCIMIIVENLSKEL